MRAGTAGVVGRGGSRRFCLSRQHASMRQQRWPTMAKEGGPQQLPVHMTDPSPHVCGTEVPPSTRTSTQCDVFHCEVCHGGVVLRMVRCRNCRGVRYHDGLHAPSFAGRVRAAVTCRQYCDMASLFQQERHTTTYRPGQWLLKETPGRHASCGAK